MGGGASGYQFGAKKMGPICKKIARSASAICDRALDRPLCCYESDTHAWLWAVIPCRKSPPVTAVHLRGRIHHPFLFPPSSFLPLSFLFPSSLLSPLSLSLSPLFLFPPSFSSPPSPLSFPPLSPPLSFSLLFSFSFLSFSPFPLSFLSLSFPSLPLFSSSFFFWLAAPAAGWF